MYGVNDEIKVQKKQGFQFTARQFLKNLLLTGVLFAVVVNVFNLEPLYIGILSILIIGYLLFQSFKFYKDYIYFLKVKSNIASVLKIKETAKGNLKEMINTNQMMLERHKLLLDLLKSFSPLPIIIFISGLIININFSADIIKWLSKLTFSTKVIYTFVMAIFIIWYAIKLVTTWEKYKLIQFINLQYQNAYDNLKENK